MTFCWYTSLEWAIKWKSIIMETFPSPEGGIQRGGTHNVSWVIFPYVIGLFLWHGLSNFEEKKKKKKKNQKQVAEPHFHFTFFSWLPPDMTWIKDMQRRFTANDVSSFLLSISFINVIKFPDSCGFGPIYWRDPLWKISFFVQCFSSAKFQVLARAPVDTKHLMFVTEGIIFIQTLKVVVGISSPIKKID